MGGAALPAAPVWDGSLQSAAAAAHAKVSGCVTLLSSEVAVWEKELSWEGGWWRWRAF